MAALVCMDDTLKNLALGFFALATLHASLEPRIRHDAVRQVRESFEPGGSVRAEVAPRGALGLLVNDVWAIDLYSDHQRATRLPFYLYPRGGWKGSIRHLRLHFTNFTLNGYTVDRLDADIPFAKYDLGYAFYKGRLLLRSAEPGPASVRIGPENLRLFISRKFQKTLSDVEVWLQNKKFYIKGKVSVFGSPLPFTAVAGLAPRAGRYLDITRAQVRMSGLLVAPSVVKTFLDQINPVLDSVNDLGLGGFFTITDVEIGETQVEIRGQLAVPPASEPTNHKENLWKPR